MPPNPAVDQITDRLLNDYVAVQADIDRQLLAIADTPTRAALRQRLTALRRGIDAAMADLDTAARAWVSTDLVDIYALGGEGAGLGDFAWNQGHRAAAQVLAADTFDDLLSATKYLRTDVKRFVRQAARQHVRGAVIGGQTATQAGRSLASALRARFGELDLPAAVKYSNGARHGIGEYGSMVVRTRSAETYTRGTLNQSHQAGVRYMECFDGPACGLSSHGDSDKANGQVLPIEVADAYPLAHPNCARSWGPRPDITSTGGAKAADRFTDSERSLAAKEEDARAEVRTVGGRLTARGRALARGRARRRIP